MKKIIIILGIFLSVYGLKSQNQIWYIDGTVKEAKSVEINEFELLKYTNKKDKVIEPDTAEVFCVITVSDTTFFYDNPNYPLEKAKNFMQGQIDGKNYNNYYVYTGAFLTGAASPVAMNYVAIIDLISPLIAVGYVASFSKVNEQSRFCNIDKKYQANEDYIKGYKYSASRKKIRNSAIFATTGLVCGYFAAYLINK